MISSAISLVCFFRSFEQPLNIIIKNMHAVRGVPSVLLIVFAFATNGISQVEYWWDAHDLSITAPEKPEAYGAKNFEWSIYKKEEPLQWCPPEFGDNARFLGRRIAFSLDGLEGETLDFYLKTWPGDSIISKFYVAIPNWDDDCYSDWDSVQTWADRPAYNEQIPLFEYGYKKSKNERSHRLDKFDLSHGAYQKVTSHGVFCDFYLSDDDSKRECVIEFRSVQQLRELSFALLEYDTRTKAYWNSVLGDTVGAAQWQKLERVDSMGNVTRHFQSPSIPVRLGTQNGVVPAVSLFGVVTEDDFMLGQPEFQLRVILDDPGINDNPVYLELRNKEGQTFLSTGITDKLGKKLKMLAEVESEMEETPSIHRFFPSRGLTFENCNDVLLRIHYDKMDLTGTPESFAFLVFCNRLIAIDYPTPSFAGYTFADTVNIINQTELQRINVNSRLTVDMGRIWDRFQYGSHQVRVGFGEPEGLNYPIASFDLKVKSNANEADEQVIHQGCPKVYDINTGMQLQCELDTMNQLTEEMATALTALKAGGGFQFENIIIELPDRSLRVLPGVLKFEVR